jgi:4-hydroxy-3-methylbut-2-en-1-yl diphosphate synthase IspG/GcpE
MLEDGIGDTIRVSLTGDPVKEIPVALAIAGRYNKGLIAAGSVRKDRETKASADLIEMTRPRVNPFSFRKRESEGTGSIGGNRPVQVLTGTEETLSILDENGRVCGMPGRDEAEKLLPCEGNAREMRKKALSAVAGNDKRPTAPDGIHTATAIFSPSWWMQPSISGQFSPTGSVMPSGSMQPGLLLRL